MSNLYVNTINPRSGDTVTVSSDLTVNDDFQADNILAIQIAVNDTINCGGLITAIDYYAAGEIGIGTTSPDKELHIESSTTPVIQLTRKSSIASGNDIGAIYFGGTTDNGTTYHYNSAVILCEAEGAWDTTDTDSGSRLIFEVTPDGSNSNSEAMRIRGNGDIGVGGITPYNRLDVYTDDASTFVAHFTNNGNNLNRYGILVTCGTDDATGANIAFQCQDGNGTNQGQISFTGGTVTYGAFTAYHPAALPEGIDSYDYGTIVKIKSTNLSSFEKSVQYDVEQTMTAQDKAVFGVYAVEIGEDYNQDGSPGQEHNRHQIWAIGDGHILVCLEGGNIETGDYICSSNTPGHGMKQDDDLLHNYTVAKATEVVDWSIESGSIKLIACTYHAG